MVLAAVLGILLLSACDSGLPEVQIGEGGDVRFAGPRAAKVFGQWTVKVRVRPAQFGSLWVTTRRLKSAPGNDAKPWLEHELVFRNLGEEALWFDDTRDSGFVREGRRPILLVADEGCGYGMEEPNGRIQPGACTLYLDEFVIRPERSTAREVTLYKGLRDFRPLREGTYRYRKLIRFGVGGSDTMQEHTVTLIYEISSAN